MLSFDYRFFFLEARVSLRRLLLSSFSFCVGGLYVYARLFLIFIDGGWG